MWHPNIMNSLEKPWEKSKLISEVFEIEALGERDLSRGVREWGSPKMWMWINSEFSHDEAFNITKLSVEEGDIDAGYFYTGCS